MDIIKGKITSAGITTAKAMNAVTITAMKAAAIITVKTTSADIITEKASTAAMKRATRAAAVITASKPLCVDHIRTELSRIIKGGIDDPALFYFQRC